MNELRLTLPDVLATSRRMMRRIGFIAGMLNIVPLGACVSVSAPDKPIVIELNINVKQEVVYRLAADANKTIDENKQIF